MTPGQTFSTQWLTEQGSTIRKTKTKILSKRSKYFKGISPQIKRNLDAQLTNLDPRCKN
jgi:hypothetical protein